MALQIKMLGGFSISNGEKSIMQTGTRSRKTWSLLSYIIFYRNRSITTDKLMDLLWDEDKSTDPLNALKVTLHRIRTNLNNLGDDTGRNLVVYRDGRYTWNNDAAVKLDVDEFEQLCRKGASADDDKKKISCWKKAVDLYAGDFLPLLSNESWVMPTSAYYHNLFIQTVQNLMVLLDENDMQHDMVKLCRTAISHEPYAEEFYLGLMQALCKTGDYKAAVATYEEMRDLFFTNLGVLPSDELQSIYRTALSEINDHSALPPGIIMEQLKEPEIAGAFFCDYDVFKYIYRAQARCIIRSGDIAQIALFGLTTRTGEHLAKRSLDVAAANFKEILKTSLRRGDIISRCSMTQFIVMLNQSNFENAQMLSDRLVQLFNRQYPHSPAIINVSIYPIEPN